MQGHKLHTFLFGMFHLLQACGHLFFTTAINDHGTFGTQAASSTDRVHCCIATTDDSHFLTLQDRRIAIRIGSIHQIDTCQVFVGRHHPDQVLSRNIHKVRKPGAAGSEDSFETIRMQIVITDCLADNTVCHELHTHLAQPFNFYIHNLIRQAEFGNTVFQHTTDFVQSFEHRHVIATLCHITGKRKAGGT